MANPKLAALNQKAELGPLKEVVVLTKTATLLAGRLGPKGDAPKTREKCLAFIRRNRQALKSLGIEFDTPAFELKGNMLRLKVVWRGPTWGGLGRMPAKTRAVLNAGLPLARALGSEVLPLPDVKSADIWVACEDKPGGDQLAASGVVSVVLGSSAKDLIRLGNGEITPRNFVRENPVVTRRTGG